MQNDAILWLQDIKMLRVSVQQSCNCVRMANFASEILQLSHVNLLVP